MKRSLRRSRSSLAAVASSRRPALAVLRLLRGEGGREAVQPAPRRWSLVRDGDRTVLTMANDFQGDPTEFAIVVPVPTVPDEGADPRRRPALVERLDAYSAPRLVEYFDDEPVRRGRAVWRRRRALRCAWAASDAAAARRASA